MLNFYTMGVGRAAVMRKPKTHLAGVLREALVHASLRLVGAGVVLLIDVHHAAGGEVDVLTYDYGWS